MRFKTLPLLFFLISTAPGVLHASDSTKEPVIPPGLAFERTLDVEGYAERIQDHGRGAQTLRIRTRYLDPDVNAFVGLVTGFQHFNQDLRIGDPSAPDTAGTLWNWGGVIGIRRGKHLWELDLMGTVLSSRLGPALAVVGEHHLTKSWLFYHRTEVNLFTGDMIFEADQGLYWNADWWGFELGYRYWESDHTNRSGPHAGFRLYFNNPKIPFLFPSLG